MSPRVFRETGGMDSTIIWYVNCLSGFHGLPCPNGSLRIEEPRKIWSDLESKLRKLAASAPRLLSSCTFHQERKIRDSQSRLRLTRRRQIQQEKTHDSVFVVVFFVVRHSRVVPIWHDHEFVWRRRSSEYFA